MWADQAKTITLFLRKSSWTELWKLVEIFQVETVSKCFLCFSTFFFFFFFLSHFVIGMFIWQLPYVFACYYMHSNFGILKRRFMCAIGMQLINRKTPLELLNFLGLFLVGAVFSLCGFTSWQANNRPIILEKWLKTEDTLFFPKHL